MRPAFALSILIGLAAQAVALDEWRQSSFTYAEIEDSDVPVLVENRGTTPTVLNPASGFTPSRLRYIVGAAQQNPPTWHAKFTPLQQSTVSRMWSHGYQTIYPGYGFTVRVWWLESGGEQEFELYQNGQSTGLTIDRQRSWNDPLDPIEYLTYPLSSPPGGRLPPGDA